MRINLFYPAVLLVGVGLYFLLQQPAKSELNFYGFAESDETSVNYNYPVVIDELLVQPGQAVKAGQPLLRVSRRKSKETLADQQFRIDELRAEQTLWTQRKSDELTVDGEKTELRLTDLNERLAAAREELRYKQSLAAGLRSIEVGEAEYQPLREKINNLEAEVAGEAVRQADRESRLKREMNLGKNPYREQIRRLEAELEFDAEQQVIPFIVEAPADGLIGNVMVREQEHVPSYDPLLSFYAPHSNIVRGYVHENQTMEVRVGDTLLVYSLKVADLRYKGVVTGLGSRIVEIPARLRKLPEFKTYGREVILSIPSDNGFLQKEKVGLRSAQTPFL